MTRESRTLAGILLLTLPTVMAGGLALLALLVERRTGYWDHPLRQDLWRAGHAHAGVYLVLSLVVLRYVDEARLSSGWKWLVRLAAPVAAILIPAGFFLAVPSPTSYESGPLLVLVYPGAAVLALGVIVLGIGLVRAGRAPGP